MKYKEEFHKMSKWPTSKLRELARGKGLTADVARDLLYYENVGKAIRQKKSSVW